MFGLHPVLGLFCRYHKSQLFCLTTYYMLLYSIDVLMAQDQSQPQQLQLQQQQYLTSQAQLQQQQQQQQQCMQQTDSNLSAASYHSSGGASDEHPTHSTEQVCLPPTYLKFVFFYFHAETMDCIRMLNQFLIQT